MMEKRQSGRREGAYQDYCKIFFFLKMLEVRAACPHTRQTKRYNTPSLTPNTSSLVFYYTTAAKSWILRRHRPHPCSRRSSSPWATGHSTSPQSHPPSPLPTSIFVPNKRLHTPLFPFKHSSLAHAALFTTAINSLLTRDNTITVTVLPISVKLPPRKSKADPRLFSIKWPGPPRKDHVLADLRASAQSPALPTQAAPTPKRHAFLE